jgi:protein dithiol:quinone oxidoreductase
VFSDTLTQRRSARGLWLIAALAFGAVGVALVSQHVFGMLPCPWCILQRLLFLIVGLAAMVAAWLPVKSPRLVATAVVLVGCVAGAAAALYQHFVASHLQSCALTLADRILTALRVESWWPWLLSVQASCADAAVKLLGLSYELWALAMFVLLGLLALAAMARTSRPR